HWFKSEFQYQPGAQSLSARLTAGAASPVIANTAATARPKALIAQRRKRRPVAEFSFVSSGDGCR
ncbi:MAG: hypothetical protein WAO15_01620, partial [Mycobacterium sp.]